MQNGVGGDYITRILPFADKKSLPLDYTFETAVYGDNPDLVTLTQPLAERRRHAAG